MNEQTKQAHFMTKINMPYEFKIAYAETRIKEFITECAKMNKDTIVSVGGLDSITLYYFINNVLKYNVKGVSISSIEHKTVREIHKILGIEEIKPLKSKYHILKEYGYPLFSKEISQKMVTIQNPTPNNIGYRNAILTGLTTGKASVKYSSCTKMPDKYIKMLIDNEIPCKLSNKCCIYMKEKPMEKYCTINNCYPFLGLQATESHRRFLSLSKNGCNYFNGKSTRSAPFAIFNKSDVLRLAVEIGVPIPKIYGDIIIEDNEYKTTGQSRTGCDICGFGIQFEKTRPHRFDKLYIEDFKKWDFWINQMEYGKIFKHIGFKYEQPFVDGESAWVKNHE